MISIVWRFSILFTLLMGAQCQGLHPSGLLPSVVNGRAYKEVHHTPSLNHTSLSRNSSSSSSNSAKTLMSEYSNQSNANPSYNSNSNNESAFVLKEMVILQKEAEQLLHIKHNTSEKNSVDMFFESDIILTPAQAEAFAERIHFKRRRKRKITAELSRRWNNPIFYSFDKSHDLETKLIITQALRLWETETCIKFREISPTDKAEMLVFTSQHTCWSFVGRTHTRQNLSIAKNCAKLGTVLHEIAHALGFWHEQSRPDRDTSVKVEYDNIKPGKEYNFIKRTWLEVTDMGVPYDPGSNMHYGAKYFSKNNRDTIKTRNPLLQRVLGQRRALSFYDVKLANLAYCAETCKNTKLNCKHDGYPNPKNCSMCKCPIGLGGRLCDFPAFSIPASCGGNLDAGSGIITTPNYPNSYSAGQQCNWLITAPIGSHVYIIFHGDYEIQCNFKNTDICDDYVEIRYTTNLAATGARFCCKDPGPTKMISHTNQMLVLFRAYNSGYKGFQATFYTESCGGCHAQYPVVQEACSRRVPYACIRKWKERMYRPCKSMAWWTKSASANCGYVFIEKNRTEICYREMQYCCHPFRKPGPQTNICTSVVPRYIQTNYFQDDDNVNLPNFPDHQKENEPAFTPSDSMLPPPDA